MKPKSWKKLPPFIGHAYQGCLNCPAKPSLARMSTKVAVGLGDAHISRDGVVVWCETRPGKKPLEWNRIPRLSRFEKQAKADPRHDWRLVLMAPLSYVEYQRQGPGRWLLVKTGQGFA